jgi:hypothetical protein
MTDVEAEGGCTCRAIRYRTRGAPLVVHCCHCRWCQRETGSAFVLNALFEAEHVLLSGPSLDVVVTPSASGKGQKIHRCPSCRVALFSNYAQAGDAVRFMRVGTFDQPDAFPPDVHIYTQSKQPWVLLPSGVPAVDAFYDPKQVWSEASRQRWAALRARQTPAP